VSELMHELRIRWLKCKYILQSASAVSILCIYHIVCLFGRSLLVLHRIIRSFNGDVCYVY
jgi:hypothetical protein